ncbi:MAG: FN3 associated domain-containing protein [Streptococcus sp.]
MPKLNLLSKTVELISDIDANICYTTDGSVPSLTSSRYDQPLTISKSMTVKAIAERDGKTSAVTTLDYIIAPVVVQADKPAGTYDGSVVVEFRVQIMIK